MLDRIILRPSDALPRLPRDERRSLTLAGTLFLAARMAPAEEDEGGDVERDGERSLRDPGARAARGRHVVEEADDAVANAPWTSVGAGVAYKRIGAGSNVVIIYGGYTAQLEWVERWCNEPIA